jgi:hypothetical protein
MSVFVVNETTCSNTALPMDRRTCDGCSANAKCPSRVWHRGPDDLNPTTNEQADDDWDDDEEEEEEADEEEEDDSHDDFSDEEEETMTSNELKKRLTYCSCPGDEPEVREERKAPAVRNERKPDQRRHFSPAGIELTPVFPPGEK